MARPLSLILYRQMMNALRAILPIYLARRAQAQKEDEARLTERYGLYEVARDKTPHSKSKTRIWLHAVSVGEATAALALANALMPLIKDAEFLVTTGTVSAARVIDKAASQRPIIHRYAPFDAPVPVARFFDHHLPDCGIIFESDFWPVMMSTAHERHIPLLLASAQMSSASAQNWQKYPSLASYLFAPITACFTHDDAQTALFQSLGVQTAQTIGSLKLPHSETRKTTFATKLSKLADKRLVILGASTHEGEESQLLRISEALQAKGLAHLLIIAPRHPERGDKLASLLSSHTHKVARRSYNEMPAPSDSIYLCDSLGDMPSLYQAADIVWLGASFSGKGGHNPLEAASYGKPIICGPSQFKNQYEYDQLTALGVCHLICDVTSTAQFITELSCDDDRRKHIARLGKKYAKQAAMRPTIVAQKIAHLLDNRRQKRAS